MDASILEVLQNSKAVKLYPGDSGNATRNGPRASKDRIPPGRPVVAYGVEWGPEV
jgi:hypothetical protein